MSKKNNGVNYGKTTPQQSRRRRALDQLNTQLKSGKKPIKNQIGDHNGMTELTDKDINRINKEIEILKNRL